MKGMTTCKICGRDFALMAEEHYVACDPQNSGVIASLVSTDKAYEYDAFDCPHCGCQFVAQARKPKVVQDEITSKHISYDCDDCDDCDDCGDCCYSCFDVGCDSCKFDNLKDYEEPCCSCSNCNINMKECKYEEKNS